MNLDVLIPSLLLPAPILALRAPPRVPALETLLARADQHSEDTATGSSWLCKRWGMTHPYSIAPVLAEYDGFDATGGGWMFAEPVHLKPERDQLDLLAAGFLDLSAHETTELISALNAHFADRGLQFFAQTPARWYVRCAHSEIPVTHSPFAPRTGSLIDFQPRSAGKMDWRSLQNESQMLFFGHHVNEAREAIGKTTVSGVWFWGGGTMPALERPTYDCVAASLPFAIQLARKTRIDSCALSLNEILSAQGNVLAILDSCSGLTAAFDLLGWEREIERLEHSWFEPLNAALLNGTVERLNLYVPDGTSTREFHITRANRHLRFWRRTKPLARYA